MEGKADWMAFGLPVEGSDGPFAGQQLVPLVTCRPGQTVGEARSALDGAGRDRAIVVHDDLAVGSVDRDLLAGAGAGDRLLGVMAPVPSTIRPSVLVSTLADAGSAVVVTSSDGRLLGGFEASGEAGSAGVEGGGAGGGEDVGGALETELHRTLAAVRQRFGEREPSEAELRSFLHEQLEAEGWSPEESDRLLAELDHPAEE